VSKLLLCALKGRLRGAPLGNIARHLGIPDQDALRVADRVDDDIRPKRRPILADTPALCFVSPTLQRRSQRARRLAGGAIGLRVEARKVLTDDFLRRVALDPLGAGIPAGYIPMRVQHEDRVIRHGINEQLQPCRVRKVAASYFTQLMFTKA
jgi:hypothetical protein